MPIRIGINGFGRIGRLVYRIAAQRGNFEIVGVNDLVPADNLAYLLQHDSSHGRFAHEVKAGGDGFTAGVQKTGFVPIRKPGKLPWKTNRVEYSLEYGKDAVEIHQDGVKPGERVLLVDDLLATGGTAAACAELVERVGGELCGLAFVVELADLNGRAKLPAGVPVESLIVY